MKKVIIFSLNDSDPSNPGKIDLLSFGQFDVNIAPKSGSFTGRTGNISLIKALHLLRQLFTG